MIATVTALHTVGVSVAAACVLLGVARSSYYRITRGYRHYTPVTAPRPQSARIQPAALSDEEHAHLIDVLCSPDYADLSVFQTYWRAFDAGLLSSSQRTFYRVAKKAQLVGDRRHRKRVSGCRRSTPRVVATAPGQLWSWDATELHGPGRQRFKLLLAIDVFSRFPVASKVVPAESACAAVAMFTEAFTRHGPPQMLHADNGAVMRSNDLLDALEGAGVVASFSRPRVSDDNPFSESLFKTVKYDLTCPPSFDDISHAADWTDQFLHAYAHEHRHSGIGCYTPASVHDGSFVEIRNQRQTRLDTLYAQHPERYRHRHPQAPNVPAIVGINHKSTTKKISVTHLSQTG